jgi:AmiR/NasT family two-component response regulator
MPDENIDLDDALEVLLALEARMHHEEVEQLREALASSRQIGVAIGVVMCQEGLDRDDAFSLLVRASRNSNRKLRDVAASVEASGRLPL